MHAEADLRDDPGDDSERGDVGHDIMAMYCDGVDVVGPIPPDLQEPILFLQRIVNDAKAHEDWKGAEILVEHEVDLSHVDPTIGKGTIDFALVIPFSRATIFDWKFGGKLVAPASYNPQTIAYAEGLRKEYDLEEVIVIIAYGTLRWCSVFSWKSDSLSVEAKNLALVSEACRSIDLANPPLCPGEWCSYCKALATCSAVLKKLSQAPLAMNPDRLPGQQLAEFLAWSDLASVWAGKVKQEAMTQLCAGREVPGWQIVYARGKRAWVEGAESGLAQAAAFLGKKVKYTDPELVSPASLEEVWGKSKEVRELLEPLIVRGQGSPRLERKEEEVDHAATVDQ
jgi:hypothetical protein